MRHPLIDALDLRSPKVLADNADAKKVRWDWPAFPDHIASFIETGKVERYNRAHLRAYAAGTLRLLYDISMMGQLTMGETFQGGAMLWRQSRWMRFLRYFGLAPQLPVPPTYVAGFEWDEDTITVEKHTALGPTAHMFVPRNISTVHMSPDLWTPDKAATPERKLWNPES